MSDDRCIVSCEVITSVKLILLLVLLCTFELLTAVIKISLLSLLYPEEVTIVYITRPGPGQSSIGLHSAVWDVLPLSHKTMQLFFGF